MSPRLAAAVLALWTATAACVPTSGDSDDPPGATTEDTDSATDTTAGPATEPVPDPFAAQLAVSERTFTIGVSGFIPPHYPSPSDDDWAVLFDVLPQFGEDFGVHAAWDDTLQDGIPEQVHTAYETLGDTQMAPYVALGVEPDALSQAQADAYFAIHATAFVDVATAVAAEYAPRTLLIGIEVNRFWEKSPTGFADFLDVYADAYDAVKAIRPQTRIAPNFQYEYMLGAATRAGPHDAHLDLIAMFGTRIDLTSITTYPWLEYDRVADLPLDYFAALSATAERPLMISETGWPSDASVFPDPAVAADVDEQVDYLLWLVDAATRPPLDALIWAFPHDPNIGIAEGSFDSISLRFNDGATKPTWAYWAALRDL